jgi:hypothetical protein
MRWYESPRKWFPRLAICWSLCQGARAQEQLSAAPQLVSGKENLSMADTKKSRNTVRAKVWHLCIDITGGLVCLAHVDAYPKLCIWSLHTTTSWFTTCTRKVGAMLGWDNGPASTTCFGACVKMPLLDDSCPPKVYSVPAISTPLWKAPTPKSYLSQPITATT